jgi:NAD(P)-dependent dehydrogenase (short-subunit alcohol dehydrogenase family)
VKQGRHHHQPLIDRRATWLPLRTPYSAAKCGVVGLTKSLAIERGPANIRVNAIQPGAVKGPRVGRVIEARAKARGIVLEEARSQFRAPISLRHTVTAEEIAAMAVFLAGPPRRRVSGQAISICGDHASLT